MVTLKFGREKDPVRAAQEREERLRQELDAAEERRRELEERTDKTPMISAANMPDVPTPPSPPPLSAEEKRLENLLAEWSATYEGAFPELGHSAHASVERSLLLAIYGELRELRRIMGGRK